MEAFDRALAADPGFALAHAGKAQVHMRYGEAAAARAALATAKDLAGGLPAREASHVAFFDLVFSGQTDAALAAMHEHLTAWPRDALVVATAANPNGLIGGSGRIGQKHQVAVLMDSLAPQYGDDPWFLSYHAMALSEDGRLAAARPMIERSVTANPHNAHGAHGFAHICYESGEPDTGRAWLSSWLATYPREAFFHGHLSWHLSLCELQAGNWDAALRLYRDAIVGGPAQRRAAAEDVGWGGVPVAVRTRRAIRATPRPGAGCTPMRARRCRGRAAGWPTCT